MYRGKHCFIMLNRYPYNNGHLMIVPYAHKSKISDLEQADWHELCDLIPICESAYHETYSVDGINVGINLGSAAGAGIAEHLHVHMVPRWQGDSNFMTVIAGERVIPEAFEESYKKLRTAILQQIKIK